MLEGEGTFVDGTKVEVKVARDYLFVVDKAGESKVDGARLTQGGQSVVFPVQRRIEGVGITFVRKDFLEGGDVVENGGVHDDAKEGIVTWCSDGDGEGVQLLCGFSTLGGGCGGVESEDERWV